MAGTTVLVDNSSDYFLVTGPPSGRRLSELRRWNPSTVRPIVTVLDCKYHPIHDKKPDHIDFQGDRLTVQNSITLVTVLDDSYSEKVTSETDDCVRFW
jgi:hypothetical protein